MGRRSRAVVGRAAKGPVGLAVLVVLGILVAAAVAAPPAWDISGRWTSYVGDLQLSQKSDGSVSGTFRMKIGCTEAYDVTGKVDGSAVSLALVRASGAGDAPPCAGTQTLKGSIGSTGSVMQLALANPYQTSPATPFAGRATRPGPTAPASTFTTTSTKLITCTGRNKLCREVFAVTVKTGKGPLVARFTTSSRHCSDVRLRISVDGGEERLSGYLGPTKSTPEYTFQVAAGQHRVQVRAEGRRGGCNKLDYLAQWEGTLQIRAVR